MFRSCIAALFPASGVAPAAAGAARTSCVAVVCPSSPLCRSLSSTAATRAKLPLLSSSHCPPSFFGWSPAALFTSRRYQRSTPARTHTSTWQDKTHRFEKYQREQQDEALRAAQRRAKYATGASASVGTSTLSTTSFSKSASATEPLTRPSGGFWSFMRGGSEGRKTQPMNPLMHLSKWGEKSKHDPEARTAQRLLEAINGLNKRNSRRREPLTVQLSDTQRQEIVNRYASTRWYARLYAPFRSWSERRVRWGIRICNVVLVFIVSCLIVVVVASYFREMDAIAQLSPEDQRDYAYMVRGMRYSDIYKVGAEVLKREDPLEALPPAVRLHMVIEACRQKKWHELDWNVELRKMHPASPLEEWDYLHLLYWAILTIGSLTSGGGVMFSNRVLDVREVRHGSAESAEEKDRFVEMEPTSLPARKQRTFF
ncbi:hypothetical protein, conserved [Leishmania tarentolae]|uniref:Transmembrane protein n=1 Tax=Leishmania tarentolae TaxID=5689 RepID=A0A640KEI9_LEITA|nr:hypothetical protein, conserved [Leishmania tarentolae]